MEAHKHQDQSCTTDKIKLTENNKYGEVQNTSFLFPDDMQCDGDQALDGNSDKKSKDTQSENKEVVINLNLQNHCMGDSQFQICQTVSTDSGKENKQEADIKHKSSHCSEKRYMEQTDCSNQNTHIDKERDDIQSDCTENSIQFELSGDCGQYETADALVRKLCKSGKLMKFQDEDNYIKVFVYEDSGETDDHEDTLSAEEIERTSEGGVSAREQNESKDMNNTSKNLLDCLLESNRDNVQMTAASTTNTSPNSKRLRLMPSSHSQNYESIVDAAAPVIQHNGQWYEGVLSSQAGTPASAIQSNFVHTVSQFAPNFLPSTLTDIESSGTTTLGKGSNALYTPHPRSGQVYYTGDEAQNLSREIPLATSSPTHYSNVPNPVPRVGKGPPCKQPLLLNSSGEETVSPTGIVDTPTGPQQHQMQKVRSLIQSPGFQIDDLGKLREQHNQKERKRRARIKEACNLLRQLVPGMSDKTDKATVFEFAARYVHFLKSHTGPQFDKDFLMKYSPY